MSLVGHGRFDACLCKGGKELTGVTWVFVDALGGLLKFGGLYEQALVKPY